MRIGIHAYVPSLSRDVRDPTGISVPTRHLIDLFRKNGHEVYWLAPEHVPGTTTTDAIDFLDVVLFFWRWEMTAKRYEDRQAAYLRQNFLIEECHRVGIPIVVHDQDKKMLAAEVSKLEDYGAILTVPDLMPTRPFRMLHYPYPYGFELPQLRWDMRAGCVYAGNNYQRYEQAKLYLNAASEQSYVGVYGNWLEHSSSRQSPEQVHSDFPNVSFRGFVPQVHLPELMATYRYTVHLVREDDGSTRTGFMAIRWAEAVQAHLPAIIPTEFNLWEWEGRVLGQPKTERGLRNLVRSLAHDEYFNKTVLQSQREFVKAVMCDAPWLKIVQEATK